MIRGFRDRATEDLFAGRESTAMRKFPPDLRVTAKRKLVMIAAAADLKDLATLPGNRLEALKGRLKGRYSIRVNDQWRVVFRWEGGHADEVEIVDYH
jgi:proteic killer suppression protein